MKKYFIFTDIHSYFSLLMDALTKAGYDRNNPDHIIVSLGDLLDRGDESVECLEFVNSIPAERKILIRGNHEDLMEEAISRGYFMEHDRHNGTDKTAKQLTNLPLGSSNYEILEAMKDNGLWNTYINSTVNYYELGDNIFVHGWIPYEIKPNKLGKGKSVRYVIPDKWREPYSDWENARWSNGMDCWDRGITLPNKTVYCGHYHCSWGNAYLHGDGTEFLDRVETYYIDPITEEQEPHVNWKPFKDKGIVAMDACTAYSQVVNVEVIEVNDEDKNNS